MSPSARLAIAEAPLLAVGVVLDLDPTQVVWGAFVLAGGAIAVLARREWRRLVRRVNHNRLRLSAMERGEKPPVELDDDP